MSKWFNIILMLKKIFKDLLSNSFLRDSLNLSWSSYYDVTFHDIANNYKEAQSKIDNNPKFKNLKDTNSLINKIINQTNDFIDEHNSHTYLIPIIVSISNQSVNKIKSILDVGGGLLPVSLYIKKYCNIEIPGSIIETPEYTKVLNALCDKKNISFMRYFSDVSNLDNKNFDLVYFGSSIQYLKDDVYITIKKTISYNPKLIAITNNFFIDQDDDLYSLQAFGGRKHLIPHKFFSYKKMITFFNNEKYKLILDIDHENSYNHKKLDNKDFKNKSLLFIKQY